MSLEDTNLIEWKYLLQEVIMDLLSEGKLSMEETNNLEDSVWGTEGHNEYQFD